MLTKFLNNYGYMILGGAMIFGFSAFKSVEVYSGKKLSPATVYFHGDATDPAQVADESRWTTTPNGESCDNTDELACSIVVDNTDLSGNTLNTSKIQLEAQPINSGYVHQLMSGSNPTQFQPINKSE